MGCGVVGEASKDDDDLPCRSTTTWIGFDDMFAGRV